MVVVVVVAGTNGSRPVESVSLAHTHLTVRMQVFRKSGRSGRRAVTELGSQGRLQDTREVAWQTQVTGES